VQSRLSGFVESIAGATVHLLEVSIAVTVYYLMGADRHAVLLH